jgi:hypothetical protein
MKIVYRNVGIKVLSNTRPPPKTFREEHSGKLHWSKISKQLLIISDTLCIWVEVFEVKQVKFITELCFVWMKVTVSKEIVELHFCVTNQFRAPSGNLILNRNKFSSPSDQIKRQNKGTLREETCITKFTYCLRYNWICMSDLNTNLLIYLKKSGR